jgi:hypothetical protein
MHNRFRGKSLKMGLLEIFQESPRLRPYWMFPTRARKYVRLTAQQAYESINNIFSEVSGSKVSKLSRKETLMTKARLGWGLGATVTIHVLSEGDVSALDFIFSYRRVLGVAVVVCVIPTLLGLFVLQSVLASLGFILIIPLVFYANYSAVGFLDLVNRILPFIEKEFAHKVLMADRERWKAQPKDTEALYKRLSEKHVKTWGNTKVLEYKITEYQKLGLTRNEAIRKAAEEEGVD